MKIKVENFPDIDFKALSYSLGLCYTHIAYPENGEVYDTMKTPNNTRLIFITNAEGRYVSPPPSDDLMYLHYIIHNCKNPDAAKLKSFLTSVAQVELPDLPTVNSNKDQEFRTTFVRSSKILHNTKQITDKNARAINRAIEVGYANIPGDFVRNDAHLVLQRDIAITFAESNKPVLATNGLGPCVAVAMYFPKSKKAILAHVDGLTNIESLQVPDHLQITDPLQTFKIGDCMEVHLAGGNEDSIDIMAGIIDFFRRQPNATIKSANLGALDEASENNKSRSLAIDARTGNVFSSFTKDKVEIDKPRADKVEKRLYSGRNHLELSYYPPLPRKWSTDILPKQDILQKQDPLSSQRPTGPLR